MNVRKSLLVILSGSLLLAACSSSSHRNRSPKSGGVIGLASAVPDPTAEKLARAHAHYAAGVIHEMEGEMDNALEDYSKAALEDPENESLVLDVSRRLVQNKQPE